MSKIPLFETYSKAEHNWLGYMTSRQYHPGMAKFIIQKSPMKYHTEYMGAYLLVLKPEYGILFSNKAEKDTNLDLIYLNSNSNHKYSKFYGDIQSTFSNLEQFASVRLPSEGKIGVYFFGELHDENGYVHWNIAFLKDKTLTFFDSVLDKDYDITRDSEYCFKSRSKIARAFGAEFKMFLPEKRPQWVCEQGSTFSDFYCQSWSLMFLDIYCHNKIQQFLSLDFEKYQTEIVKTWITCTINNLKLTDKEWDLFSKKKLKAFPYYLKKGKNGKPIVKKLRFNFCKYPVELVIDMFE